MFCLSHSLSVSVCLCFCVCPVLSPCVPHARFVSLALYSLLWINDSTLLIGSTCCTGSKDVPSSRWKRGSHCQQSFPQQETVFLPEPASALFLSWLTKEPFFSVPKLASSSLPVQTWNMNYGLWPGCGPWFSCRGEVEE